MKLFKNRHFFILIGIVAICALSVFAYKTYIHHKYFTIEEIRHDYDKNIYTYNSRQYGFIGDEYYFQYDHEIQHFAKGKSVELFSREGDIVFNHLGQLFLRDLDNVYEVTEDSVELLFHADKLDFAQRIEDKVYYVVYVYDGSYSKSYYELCVYDDKTKESTKISKVLSNKMFRTFAGSNGFIIEGDWLVFADGETTARIGLLNLSIGELNRVVDYYSLNEGLMEEIRVNDGHINFTITDYTDMPGYGVDDIGVNSSEDYCYNIKNGKVYHGELETKILVQKDNNARNISDFDYVVFYDYSELKEIFDYLEDPILIAPEGDVYESEVLSQGLFSFEEDENVDIYYSFNQPNVEKFGQLYTEPFLI